MQETGNISFNDLKNAIESMMFVSKRPLSIDDFVELCGFERSLVQEAIENIQKEYETKTLQIIKVANGYLMATRPQYSTYIEKLLKSPVTVTLSQQSMETLAIIAYKQPITKAEIDQIRGVMSDGAIKTLLEKNLIKEVGRAETVGRPILYGTTAEFLKHFGLHDLNELPPLEESIEKL